MSKQRTPGLLGASLPPKLPDGAVTALAAQQRAMIERATAILAANPAQPIMPNAMTPDHPLAKALGFDQAKALVESPADRRADRARHVRDEVKRLSLAGRPVREIAQALGVSYNYVVDLRASLGVGRQR